MSELVLYDGVCGLCNRLNRFILKRDSANLFLFAALQSQLAADLLRKHGCNPDELKSVYLISDFGAPNEALHGRGEAVILVLRKLGGFWAFAASVLRLVPPRAVDWAYQFVSTRRYRWFGKYDVCPVPDLAARHKFLA